MDAIARAAREASDGAPFVRGVGGTAGVVVCGVREGAAAFGKTIAGTALEEDMDVRCEDEEIEGFEPCPGRRELGIEDCEDGVSGRDRKASSAGTAAAREVSGDSVREGAGSARGLEDVRAPGVKGGCGGASTALPFLEGVSLKPLARGRLGEAPVGVGALSRRGYGVFGTLDADSSDLDREVHVRATEVNHSQDGTSESLMPTTCSGADGPIEDRKSFTKDTTKLAWSL